jgi:hypothetical protein
MFDARRSLANETAIGRVKDGLALGLASYRSIKFPERFRQINSELGPPAVVT